MAEFKKERPSISVILETLKASIQNGLLANLNISAEDNPEENGIKVVVQFGNNRKVEMTILHSDLDSVYAIERISDTGKQIVSALL
jgi:hypothetical protein